MVCNLLINLHVQIKTVYEQNKRCEYSLKKLKNVQEQRKSNFSYNVAKMILFNAVQHELEIIFWK